MRKKTTPPKDVMRLCEEIAKGHERRKKAYERKRLDIIYSTGGGFVELGRNSDISDPVAKKTERLENLEKGLDAKFIRAVEQSLSASGTDVSWESREKLRKALMLNCESGRDYPYELLGIDEFSRRDFYRRKGRFIAEIASALGLADYGAESE
ncbi:MAG: hypothetical protein LBI38_06590 [Oscillospiraceae bacterium]|jgi:hypothetical protein|nr:hypothetical protein [Oscillospiraceae bacterium]